MSGLQIALIVLALVVVVQKVLLPSRLQRKIRNLERRNKNLGFQNDVYSQVIREANIKGVAPKDVKDEESDTEE